MKSTTVVFSSLIVVLLFVGFVPASISCGIPKVFAASFTSNCTSPTVPTGTVPKLNSTFTLNVIGATGTTVTYNQNSIFSLPACWSYGGFVAHASGGYTPDDYGNYTGIPMLTLVDLVGGISLGQTVTATSGTDGYSVTYTYQEVTSGLGWGSIYTSSVCATSGACSSSKTAVATVPMTLVLAYLWNSTAISAYTCSVAPSSCSSATESAGNGPLRTVTVNSAGSLGSSALTASGAGYLIGAGGPWNKGVTTIQVNPSPTSASFSSSCANPTVPTGTIPALNSSFTLNLIGASGSTATYNQNTISSLPACWSYGGFAHGTPAFSDDYGNYTGVPLLTLVNLVGGISPGETVTVTSGTDGFSVEYTYSEVVSGSAVGWASQGYTEDAIAAGGVPIALANAVPMYPVLAYLWNNTAIGAYTCTLSSVSACSTAPSSDLSAGLGPLRTVTVASGGSGTVGTLLSAGHPWDKGVTTIKVNQAVYFTGGSPLVSPGSGTSIVYGNVTWTTLTLQGFQYTFPASISINGFQFSSTFTESLFAQYQLAAGNTYAGYYGGTFGAMSGCSSGATITLTATVNGVTKSASATCPSSGVVAINLSF